MTTLSRSGPVALVRHVPDRAEDTLMPVAQAPSENALSTTGASSTSPSDAPAGTAVLRRNVARSSTEVARRSAGPRAQLVGVPLLPDDSSSTSPRAGSRPPRHSCSMRAPAT